MAIVRLPAGKLWGNPERIALRRGLARTGGCRPSIRLLAAGPETPTYCAACAGSIDFGPVWRGEVAFCSVECSLGGNQPA